LKKLKKKEMGKEKGGESTQVNQREMAKIQQPGPPLPSPRKYMPRPMRQPRTRRE
jgi:hypothetical protein